MLVAVSHSRAVLSRLPVSTVELFQAGSFSVDDTTYLGIELNLSANPNSSVRPGHAAAKPSGYATKRYTPQGFALPGGEGCQGEVARFRAVMGNDYQTGNVNLAVFKRISEEIDQADRVCGAGNSVEASAMIHAAKAKFGYP